MSVTEILSVVRTTPAELWVVAAFVLGSVLGLAAGVSKT